MSPVTTTPELPASLSKDLARDFARRHIGPSALEIQKMLEALGVSSLEELIAEALPSTIRQQQPLDFGAALSESEALARLREIAARNEVMTSLIGQGYHGTIVPGVIQRNIFENPAWYTAYTPYQPEISQGRLEALMNFQTMICDLTALDVANASLLDEATAAAEAMAVAQRTSRSKSTRFFVDRDVHPQTRAVLETRAEPLGWTLHFGNPQTDLAGEYFGALLQYPGTFGDVHDFRPAIAAVHASGGIVAMACDPLALTLLTPPGELGADIAIGSTQRFGVPIGFGGPHAAYMAVRTALQRALPGRLVGASVDSRGMPAYRLALQTREQHIRREKATSNICTAQVLPAVVASMYAVYHGPLGLKRIAQRVASYTAVLASGLKQVGRTLTHEAGFDTITVNTGDHTAALLQAARTAGFNLRRDSASSIGISLDETTTRDDVLVLWNLFAAGEGLPDFAPFEKGIASLIPTELQRRSAFLTHPVFNRHHSETDMLRYIRSLSDKDLALDRTMIPLGSCTMKLNATSEMIPITWPEFANVHPFAPRDQLAGYETLRTQLEAWLCQATGYSGVSLQPNAGSQGEYAGLLVIRAWHAARGEGHRKVCLIPESAHGTNPASAQMSGLQVVVTKCDAEGNIDMVDLAAKCEQHGAKLACIMITYPSTYGVFDTHVKDICALVHQHGGRVYVDGANMNALVGVAAPGEFGGDVSHLNLHKTFCIPHGGGGPGVGPTCVVADLVPYLPAHRSAGIGTERQVGAVSAAPLGNAAVLPISWMYMRMMGSEGLTTATETAILSANYIAARLADHDDIHFSGEIAGIKGGGVAHECILDLRPLKDSSGVSAEDVAKRLIDYGFHAPTLSFPVAGTLMVEPTESEGLEELDRFCDAMIAIRAEIAKIESGAWPTTDNPLRAAPHTAEALLKTDWPHAYTREEAAYPVPALRRAKYWSPVGRVDNVYGDRNLMCSCPPISDYAS